VLLIIDVSGQSQSAAAIVKGFATYDSRIRIAGVILNKVGSERHRRLVTDAIVALGVPVVGALPRSETIRLPERHLGLVQAEETAELDGVLDAMADHVAAHVDLDGVRGLARAGASATPDTAARIRPPGQRIAIARDAAFSFLYPHLIQSWRAAGAELRFFSPLADQAPDVDCDACWLPGGYPELHAGQLAAAQTFVAGLQSFASTRPVHGECGGYMVLGRSLTDADGVTHAMVGLLSVETSFARRKMTLGLKRATLLADGVLGARGERLRGHEFHYATIASVGDDAAFAEVTDAYGSAPVAVGGRRGNVSASFFHVIAREI
jgi:cobyrinic acid a,c-diamide synthase